MNPHGAAKMARELMRQHGLDGWRFQFDRARRRFGACNYTRRIVSLSYPLTLLNEPAQVRDTILHEIAHALTPGSGHGPQWKAACRRIGAAPTRCYTDRTVKSPPRRGAAYQLGCPACDWWIDRRRLTPSRYLCTKCRGKAVYRIRSTGQMFVVHADGSAVMTSAGATPQRIAAHAG